LNDKEKFILLLCCELVLLCCVCNCEFKYLQDGYIENTNTICHQTLLYTDGNTDRLYITYGYTDKIYLSVYSRDHGNCSPSPWHYSRYSLHTGIPTECVRWYILETMGTVPLHLGIVYDVHYIWVYRRNMFVGIF
jgi:hypothetical protein